MLIAVANSKDTGVGQLTARFPSGYAAAARQVEKVVLASGMSASHCFFNVPISSWGPGSYDEAMPTIALRANGVLGQVKLMSRMGVDYTEGAVGANIFNGSIVSIAHEFSDDSGMVECWGDQHLLGKFTVFGCLVYDPQSKKIYYDTARPCIFNNFGQPDCVDSGVGPVHSPSFKSGWKGSSTDETHDADSPGTATKKARYWRVMDILENLRMRHSATATMHCKVNLGNCQLPYFVRWPKGIALGLSGFDRVVKFASFQGNSLLQALQRLCRYAGVYDIYCAPEDNFGSVIQILDMSGNGPATELQLADGSTDLAAAMASGTVINDGYMCESFKNGFNSACITGDAPALEIMASELDDDATVANALEPAWSDATDLAARTFIDQNGDDENAFEVATRKWPLWLCGYRIKLDFNPWKTTKWSAYSNGGRMRIKPFICTGFQQDSVNPLDWQPREIMVEKYRDFTKEIKPPAGSSSGNYWERAFRYDNLTLNPDSTIIMLSAIRDRPQNDSNWFQNPNGVLDGGGALKFGLNILPRKLRINLAVEADWPITGFANGDPNRTAARVDTTYHYTWLIASEPLQYSELLRSDKAWPEGRCILPGQTVFNRADQPGNELFSDLKSGVLQSHANARLVDVNRIENNAMLRIPSLAPGMRPGLTVKIGGQNVLVNKGVLKSVTFSMKGRNRRDPKDIGPDTWLEIGAPDWAPRQDIAGSDVPSTGGSGAPTATDHSKQTTQTDTDHSTSQQPTTDTTKTTSASESSGYAPPPASNGGPVIGPRKDADGPVIGPHKDAPAGAGGDAGGGGGAGVGGKSGKGYQGAPLPTKDYGTGPGTESAKRGADLDQRIRERRTKDADGNDTTELSGNWGKPGLSFAPGTSTREADNANNTPRVKPGGKTGGADDQVIKR